MATIEVRDARFRYEDMDMAFDLTVEAGSFLAIIGPSGAGKTTLLNLIAGFDRVRDGRILIGGRDVTDLAPVARPVTTLFQEHNLFAHLSAADNVGLGIHPGLRLSSADRTRVAEALDQVGLSGYGNRLPRQLSGGERQRIAVARALVRNRPVLLLDEPFAALGPAQRREMIALVEHLRLSKRLTVVMVSHQLEEVLGLHGRAVFIYDGRIAADGDVQSMLQNPPIAEMADYLGLPFAAAVGGRQAKAT
jgi:thiamine transport system ATP-binding protein